MPDYFEIFLKKGKFFDFFAHMIALKPHSDPFPNPLQQRAYQASCLPFALAHP
jgi:hypothetical protein